jgi:hypothetical protein
MNIYSIYSFRPSDANLQELGAVMYRQFQDRAEKLVREKALAGGKRMFQPQMTGEDACPTIQNQQLALNVGQASRPVKAFFRSLLEGTGWE